MTQNQAVVTFGESPEHQAMLAANTSGLWVPDETYASVARLYYTTLNRAPDFSGLIHWRLALEDSSSTLLGEAQNFMGSRTSSAAAECYLCLLARVLTEPVRPSVFEKVAVWL